ncbi:MAG: hypothetical protein QG608_102 [Actinomycetota bacterium]|nr:hypothetical protein [Actinomycetota bacterium]
MVEGRHPEALAGTAQVLDLLGNVQGAGEATARGWQEALVLLEFLGSRSLMARGLAAHGALKDANESLAQATHQWQTALTALRAVERAGGSGAGAGTVAYGEPGAGAITAPRDRESGTDEEGPDTGVLDAAGASDAAQARIVLPFDWDGPLEAVAEGLRGTRTPIEGRGREWGLTAVDLYRDRDGRAVALIHHDHDITSGYDPVNDPYWGRLVDPDGNLLQGQILPNLRDELARPDGPYEPTRSERSRGRAAGTAVFVIEQVTTGWLPGPAGGAAGKALSPVTERVRRGLAGRANDPHAPRRLEFGRTFHEVRGTQLELVRADFPRAAREDARRAQLVDLERTAATLGTGERDLERARAEVLGLPGYPRPTDHGFSREKCLRAVQMHHPEGRQFLARYLLRGGRGDEG